MRCYICDKVLPPQEIVFNSKTKEFEPCKGCLSISKTTLSEYDYESLDETFGGVSDEDIKEYL